MILRRGRFRKRYSVIYRTLFSKSMGFKEKGKEKNSQTKTKPNQSKKRGVRFLLTGVGREASGTPK